MQHFDSFYWFQILIAIISIILIVIFGGIKIKYYFWTSQPIYFSYHLFYSLKSPFIISHSYPSLSKNCNFLQIDIKTHNNLTDADYFMIKSLYNISPNYKKYISNDYCTNYIHSYIHGHNNNSYIALYKDFQYLFEKNNIIQAPVLKAAAIAVPYFFNKNIEILYIDSLIYHPYDIKFDQLREIIATLEYKRFFNNEFKNNSLISIYKYPYSIVPSIVIPFTIISSYYFDISSWPNKKYNIHPGISIFKCNKYNHNKFISFLQDYIHSFFTSSIIPHVSAIIHYITNELFHIYVLIQNDIIIAFYLFRTSNEKSINETGKVVYCSSSFRSPSCSESYFIAGFINSMRDLRKYFKFTILKIDLISHNSFIINNILLKYIPLEIHKHSYIFYNYVHKTIKPNDILFML